MSVLFLAWRDPERRRWYTVGRLSTSGDFFDFVYTRGMRTAQEEAGFRPLPSFPDPGFFYRSKDLFPMFANRLPSPSRPDYEDFVQWLSAPDSPTDPIAMLGVSGGRRVTDSFELFPKPEPTGDGLFTIRFFAHGLRHFSAESVARADRLCSGERLLIQHDFQNTKDPRALMLRTAESAPNDVYPIGFCPAYLLDDLHTVIRAQPSAVAVTVAKVNPAPAPAWFRVLCDLSAPWPAGYEAFCGEDYQQIERELPMTRYVSAAAGTRSSADRTATREGIMAKKTGLDGRHRDENGEISRKKGNTQAGTLRVVKKGERK